MGGDETDPQAPEGVHVMGVARELEKELESGSMLCFLAACSWPAGQGYFLDSFCPGAHPGTSASSQS